MNRMTNMVDGIGNTKYSYNGAGQLLTEDGPFASDTVTSTYSNRLRGSLSLQQPTGSWDNGFSYDPMRRLSVVSSPAGYSSYAYRAGLPTRQIAQVWLPDTAYITNQYDSVARLLNTKLNNSANAALDSYAYLYDPANERTNLTRFSGTTVGYAYDKIGQLKVAISSINTEDRGYTYDTAWNLNWLTNNGSFSQFIVDNKNELTNAPGLGTISYDANGNITNYQSSHHALYYDDENRLIDFLDTISGSETVFTYDGLGRLRIRQEYQPPPASPSQSTFPIGGGVLATETRYIYDGWRVIQERDSNNIPTVSYTRGIDLSGTMEGAGGIGGLLARSDGYSSGNWTNHDFYFADGNGNVVDMLDGNQSKVAAYTYDPFGNTVSATGILAPTNTYRFSSKEVHLNSGMYCCGFRFYDPSLQRWINRDQIGEAGGVNLYDFCLNRPVGCVDPFGFSAESDLQCCFLDALQKFAGGQMHSFGKAVADHMVWTTISGIATAVGGLIAISGGVVTPPGAVAEGVIVINDAALGAVLVHHMGKIKKDARGKFRKELDDCVANSSVLNAKAKANDFYRKNAPD